MLNDLLDTCQFCSGNTNVMPGKGHSKSFLFGWFKRALFQKKNLDNVLFQWLKNTQKLPLLLFNYCPLCPKVKFLLKISLTCKIAIIFKVLLSPTQTFTFIYTRAKHTNQNSKQCLFNASESCSIHYSNICPRCRASKVNSFTFCASATLI